MVHNPRINPRKYKNDFRPELDAWQQLGRTLGILWRKIREPFNSVKRRAGTGDTVETGLREVLHELRDPRKGTKLRGELIDAARTGFRDIRRELRESLPPTNPWAEVKRKTAKHPIEPLRKPRPAEPETQPEERKEERAAVPAEKTPPEIRKARRSEPSWLRDAGDVRRAVIWTEILRRPRPRRMGRRRP